MFSIFLIFCYIGLIFGQMPSMIGCMSMPMSIGNSVRIPFLSSNSTYQFPCFPPIDFKTLKEPPHINDQEFTECMQVKINNISRLDNQSRALFESMDNWINSTLKPTPEQKRELMNELFDIEDINKDGYLTVDELSQFQMDYFVPYFLEKSLKDPNTSQWAMSFSFDWMLGDKAKADYDRKAANEIQAGDKNGDGKVSREEMMARFGNAPNNNTPNSELKEEGVRVA